MRVLTYGLMGYEKIQRIWMKLRVEKWNQCAWFEPVRKHLPLFNANSKPLYT